MTRGAWEAILLPGRIIDRGGEPMREGRSGILTAILLAAALGMCVFGAATGEAEAVFVKAARICMECIGLG